MKFTFRCGNLNPLFHRRKEGHSVAGTAGQQEMKRGDNEQDN